MAKPTWMSTQSPRRDVLVLQQPDVDDAPDPAHVDTRQVLVLVEQLHDLTGDAEAHGRPPCYRPAPDGARYSMDSRISSSPPVISRSTLLHVDAGQRQLVALGDRAARRAAHGHGQEHQLGRGVLRDRALRRHRERLVERLRVDVVEPADPHAHPGHRTIAGPLLDGVDDRGAQPELVHVRLSSFSATISTLTVTSGSTLSIRIRGGSMPKSRTSKVFSPLRITMPSMASRVISSS